MKWNRGKKETNCNKGVNHQGRDRLGVVVGQVPVHDKNFPLSLLIHVGQLCHFCQTHDWTVCRFLLFPLLNKICLRVGYHFKKFHFLQVLSPLFPRYCDVPVPKHNILV